MAMQEPAKDAAFLSALTTEHFVLQTAASSTIAEAAARSTLYVMALSSALVAMGFASRSPTVLLSFGLVVLPAVFILGIFTVVRLVDTTLENQQYLTGISRIRGYYKDALTRGVEVSPIRHRTLARGAGHALADAGAISGHARHDCSDDRLSQQSRRWRCRDARRDRVGWQRSSRHGIGRRNVDRGDLHEPFHVVPEETIRGTAAALRDERRRGSR